MHNKSVQISIPDLNIIWCYQFKYFKEHSKAWHVGYQYVFLLVYNISEQMDGGFKTLWKSTRSNFSGLGLIWNLCNNDGIFRRKNQGTVSLLLVLLCVCVRAKLLQSCPTLGDPMDCNPPGSSVHGILQAKILERVALPSSRASSQPRDQTRVLRLLHWQEGSLAQSPSGKPTVLLYSPPKPILNHFLVISALDSGLCWCGFFWLPILLHSFNVCDFLHFPFCNFRGKQKGLS